MASHLVSQHQLSSYATPVNGAAGDATVVLGNDNTTVTGYNSHDSDGTIHVQSSSAAVFNATPAGTEGRKWMTQDTGAVYLYYDTGSSWVEVNYLRNTGGSITGPVTITSTTTPQVTVAYDGSNRVTISVASNGATTFNATGAGAAFTFSDAMTVSGLITASMGLTSAANINFDGTTRAINNNGGGVNLGTESAHSVVLYTNNVTRVTIDSAGLATFAAGVTVASGQTLTLTGATVAGQPTWSSTQNMNISGNAAGTAGSVAASALTGTTLAANVVTTSITTIGTLIGGAVPASLVTAGTFPSGAFVFQGAVSGITTLATSSTINSQTISASANFTGSMTIATTLTVTGAGTNPVKVTAASSYGMLTFNNVATVAGALGLFGGASGDDTALYHQVPTGGTHQIRVASDSVVVVSATVVAVSTDIGTATTKKLGLNVGLTSYVAETATNTVKVFVGGNECLAVSGAALGSAGDTALTIRERSGVTTQMSPVTCGANDSGGSGFRVLRVPN